MESTRNLLQLVGLVSICILGWMLQSSLFLNWDVSQLFQVTKSMMNHGRYGFDFFTPNPPLILYILSAPLFISQHFSVSLAFVFRAYVFILSFVSLGFCSRLINLIFSKSSDLTVYLFYLSLAFVFLILPTFSFGQRDHLLVVLTMPYLLAVVYQLQGRSLSPVFAMLIGFFASIGFALKPHFFITWVLVEAYFAYYKKSIFSCVRVETLVIFSVVMLYSVTTIIYYPEYFNVIIPFLSKYYVTSVSSSWFDLVVNNATLFSLAMISLYFYFPKTESSYPLATIIWIALIASLLIYFSQRTVFPHHKIPPVSFAILLLYLWFSAIFKGSRDYIAVLAGVILFLPPISIVYQAYAYGINYKNSYHTRLVQFVNTLSIPHKSLHVFSQACNIGFPLVDYANLQSAQTIDCLWVANDLVRKAIYNGDHFAKNYVKNNHDKSFFLNLIVNDFVRYKPDLVFVDAGKRNFFVDGRTVEFNYLQYFLENDDFKKEWEHYGYFDTLKTAFDNKTIQVYKRLANN